MRLSDRNCQSKDWLKFCFRAVVTPLVVFATISASIALPANADELTQSDPSIRSPGTIEEAFKPTASDEATLSRASELANSVATTDWLGALSPIALSPFFGMACLCGIALYGPDWLAARSDLFAENSPLANPYLFWSMVVLTILTSIPRFSKVSKPFALIVDKLETYSVILILICLRVFGGISDNPMPELQTDTLQAAGIASLPLDVVLAIFAGINLIVVGTVKLFFEFVIWLTPIPAIDALLEIGNKFVSGCLTAIYCFSPFMAAVLDVLMLLVGCIVFFWVSRRIQYLTYVFAFPLALRLIGRLKGGELSAERLFLGAPWCSLPLYTPVYLKGNPSTGWIITTKRFGFFRRSVTLAATNVTPSETLLHGVSILDDGNLPPLRLHHRKLPSSHTE